MDGNGSFSTQALPAPRHGLSLEGELDLVSVRELTEALAKLDGDGDVTLDLSELTFIDSTGLHAIFEHASSLNGAKLVLSHPSALTQRILEIVGMGEHPSIVIDCNGNGR